VVAKLTILWRTLVCNAKS